MVKIGSTIFLSTALNSVERFWPWLTGSDQPVGTNFHVICDFLIGFDFLHDFDGMLG